MTEPGQAPYEAWAAVLATNGVESPPFARLGNVEQMAWREVQATAAAAPAPELTAYETDIESLTEQRNRCSETADQLRGQLRAVKAIADQHALGDTPRADLARAILDQIAEADL